MIFLKGSRNCVELRVFSGRIEGNREVGYLVRPLALNRKLSMMVTIMREVQDFSILNILLRP